jgi:hypothetical protein
MMSVPEELTAIVIPYQLAIVLAGQQRFRTSIVVGF